MKLRIVSGEAVYTGIDPDGRWRTITPAPKDFQDALISIHGNPELWTVAQRTAYQAKFGPATTTSGGTVVDPAILAELKALREQVSNIKIPTKLTIDPPPATGHLS